MTMQKAVEVVAQLAERGVIAEYAVTGAVAALAYVEPTLTQDLDILVSVADFEQHPSGLLLIGPIETALAEMGYAERSGVGVLVEGWPVQFIPVASDLDGEMLRDAAEIEFGASSQLKARVARPEHLVAKAISVGRLKDLARVDAFLDQRAINLEALTSVITRFHLIGAWRTYCAKSGRPDPLALG